MVLLEHPVSGSRVKAYVRLELFMYLAMMMFLHHYLIEDIARMYLDWFFRVKK